MIRDWRERLLASELPHVEVSLSEARLSAPKLLSDTLVMAVWEAYAIGKELRISEWPAEPFSAWLLIEAAIKTCSKMQETMPSVDWSALVAYTDSCPNCRALVRKYLEEKRRSPELLFCSNATCLLRWKKQMRRPRTEQPKWPPFDYSAMMIKPHVSDHLLAPILQMISPAEIWERRRLFLAKTDIHYLYSTAYGTSFIRRQEEYYSSGPCTIFLIHAPNIIGRQNEMKTQIRGVFGVADRQENLIHLPDSLGETYSTIARFFGVERTLTLIRGNYPQNE
jgi:nucleoside diphosphate kinase